MTGDRVCHSCGCTDITPCIDNAVQGDGEITLQPCFWVAEDLCSSCEDAGDAACFEQESSDPGNLVLRAADSFNSEPLLYDAFGRPAVARGRS